MIKQFQSSVLLIVLFSFIGLSFQGCLKDECSARQTFTQFIPIYKKLDEIRTDIKIGPGKALKNPGKLYFYDNFIIINELKEGLHIIDNSNPKQPESIAFVAIPGNVDMAAKGGRLYADNYIDLLTFNIENPRSPKLIQRTENVFERYHLDQDLGYLVDYEPTQVTQTIDCSDPRFGSGWFWNRGFLTVDVADANFAGAPSAEALGNATATAAGPGIGGSLARFTIVDKLLYTVDEWNLRIFDLNNCDDPDHVSTVNVGWGIETIFPHEDRLFIGANHGMFIFDNSDPLNPVQQSLFSHARACDPVYVVGDIAYVTLRDGTRCDGFNNQLDVVDVSDLRSPRLLHSYEMDNPHGLSVLENTLFLCEGVHGMKVFDVEDIAAIDKNRLDWVKDIHSYDVIALPNKTALLIGQDGLYQFDISDPRKLQQMSVIPVDRD